MIQGGHHESTIPYLQLIIGNPPIVYMAIYVRYLPCLSVWVVLVERLIKALNMFGKES